MKIKQSIILAALLCCAGLTVQAQTFQSAFDSGVTNGAVGVGYWRGLTGNYNIASYDYVYNLTTQSNALGAGLLVGGDYLWGSKQTPVWNDVKGGVAINYNGNLAVIGFTNAVFKLAGGNAIASPHDVKAGIGDITFADIDFSIKLALPNSN